MAQQGVFFHTLFSKVAPSVPTLTRTIFVVRLTEAFQLIHYAKHNKNKNETKLKTILILHLFSFDYGFLCLATFIYSHLFLRKNSLLDREVILLSRQLLSFLAAIRYAMRRAKRQHNTVHRTRQRNKVFTGFYSAIEKNKLNQTET